MLGTEPTHPAGRRQVGLTGIKEIRQHDAGLIVVDYGARRNIDREISSPLAGSPARFAMPTAIGPKVLQIPERDEGVQLRINSQEYVAAVPTVATFRASTRHVLFPSEANGTISAIAALDEDSRSIVEDHGTFLDCAGVSPGPEHRCGTASSA